MLPPDPDARTVVIERTFDAPASLVFEAHSRPEHLLRWYGPPGYPLTLCEIDFRVGGACRFAMTGPDGEQGPAFGGEYLEIVPDRRISFSNGFELPGAEKMVVTIDLTPEGARTHLRMTTVFASLAMKEEHVSRGYLQGVGAGLDQLAALLPSLSPGARS